MTERQIFLTRAQIKELTGTANRARQIECLRSNCLPFTLDVFGRPVVTVAAVKGRNEEKATDKEDEGFLPSWRRSP